MATEQILPTEVHIPVADIVLTGDLVLPNEPKGIVLFAHGSGSSRQSPRNQYVAGLLQQEGIATFLFDLLTEHEETIDRATGHIRFDISFLAHRLLIVTDWIQHNRLTEHLKIGYFGASTGAAAAFKAVAELGNKISALVSRGGRPDLAEAALPKILAPTLLIVGGYDVQVIEFNRSAFEKLSCEKSLKIVPGASHLFEESGKLEKAARLASDWFLKNFAS